MAPNLGSMTANVAFLDKGEKGKCYALIRDCIQWRNFLIVPRPPVMDGMPESLEETPENTRKKKGGQPSDGLARFGKSPALIEGHSLSKMSL